LEYVDVVIENTGNPIPEEKKQQIFERGKRALVDAKMGKIPGTGYGLWETKAVIEAHGGMVTASSEKAGFQHRSGIPYRVTFTLRIPLSQS
jgi:signal transduction histidine kinase